METKLEIRSKIAIFSGGRPLSSYEFDTAIFIKGFVLAYNNYSFTIYSPEGTLVTYKKSKVSYVNSDSGYIIVEDNGLQELYLYNGISLLQGKFNSILLEHKAIIVNLKGMYGVYSYEGKIIVPINFDNISLERNSIQVRKNNSIEFYSYDGKIQKE